MRSNLTRRNFLNRCLSAGAPLAAFCAASKGTTRAIDAFQRAGKPRMPLSLAAYSFRDFFREGSRGRKGEGSGGKQIDLFNFIDYCADQGCHGTELTSYYFPAEVTDSLLLKLKRHAFLRGIAISGTAVGNTFTLPPGEKRNQEIASVKKWIDHAARMAAPHIRVFAGSAQNIPKAEAKRYAIEALQECCDYAATEGIMLGLENHGGVVAEPDDLLDIVRAVDSPWFGINLDTGNFHTADPYGDLARCAPYAVNVQVKTEIQPRGQSKEPADLAKLIRILRDANYQGYVVLEYEAAENPWETVPRILQQLKALL